MESASFSGKKSFLVLSPSFLLSSSFFLFLGCLVNEFGGVPAFCLVLDSSIAISELVACSCSSEGVNLPNGPLVTWATARLHTWTETYNPTPHLFTAKSEEKHPTAPGSSSSFVPHGILPSGTRNVHLSVAARTRQVPCPTKKAGQKAQEPQCLKGGRVAPKLWPEDARRK